MKDAIKLYLAILMLIIAIVATVVLVRVGVAPLVAGASAVESTLDKGVTSYEWFFDANGQLQARAAQIASYKNLVSQTQDSAERSRLLVELNGMQQSCRDLATQYNANAQKVTKTLFMSNNLPAAQQLSMCE